MSMLRTLLALREAVVDLKAVASVNASHFTDLCLRLFGVSRLSQLIFSPGIAAS